MRPAGSTCWSTMPASSMSRRCRISQSRSGTPSWASTYRQHSTRRGSRCRRCCRTSGAASSTSRPRTAWSARRSSRPTLPPSTASSASPRSSRSRPPSRASPATPSVPVTSTRRWSRRRSSAQATAHGIPREQVIRDVLLAQQPNKRFATVEELGALTVFLASEAAASITGVALPVDGGWTAH